MLRKSIPIFKIGLFISILGAVLYFYSPHYGKYLSGLGLVVISVAMFLYILFMFRRYGEHKKTRVK